MMALIHSVAVYEAALVTGDVLLKRHSLCPQNLARVSYFYTVRVCEKCAVILIDVNMRGEGGTHCEILICSIFADISRFGREDSSFCTTLILCKSLLSLYIPFYLECSLLK